MSLGKLASESEILTTRLSYMEHGITYITVGYNTGTKNNVITTLTYHFTPTRFAIIKKKILARTWRNWNPCVLLVGI